MIQIVKNSKAKKEDLIIYMADCMGNIYNDPETLFTGKYKEICDEMRMKVGDAYFNRDKVILSIKHYPTDKVQMFKIGFKSLADYLSGELRTYKTIGIDGSWLRKEDVKEFTRRISEVFNDKKVFIYV